MYPEDITWQVLPSCHEELSSLQQKYGEEWYSDAVASLRRTMCDYFDMFEKCDGKWGRTISPIGSGPNGGKRFKVRLGLPARGRSGGLRVLFEVFCERKTVVVVGAVERKDA